MSNHNGSSIHSFFKAIRICNLNNDLFQLAKCFYVCGILKEKSNIDTKYAMVYFQDSLKILKDEWIVSPDLQGCLLHHIGYCYIKTQDYEVAKKYFESSIATRPRNPDSYQEIDAGSFYFLGKAEYYLKDFNSSLKDFKTAFSLFQRICGKKSIHVVRSLIGLATTHACLHEDFAAISCLNEAMVYREQLQLDGDKEITKLLGLLHAELRDFETAIKKFEAYLSLEAKENVLDIIMVRLYLASLYCQQGFFDCARKHCEESMRLNVDETREYDKILSLILEKLGDIEFCANDKENAISFYTKAKELTHTDPVKSMHLLIAICECYFSHDDIDKVKDKKYENRSVFDELVRSYDEMTFDRLSHSDQVNFHQCIGSVYLQRGEKQKALKNFMDAIKIHENRSLTQGGSNSISSKVAECALRAYRGIFYLIHQESKWTKVSSCLSCL